MAGEIGKGYIVVTPDKDAWRKGVAGLADDGGRSEKVGSGIGKKLVGGIVAAVAAAGAVKFLGGAIAEGREAEKVMAQTAAAIKSTGGAAGVSAGDVDKLATSISNMTGIDDEAIAGAENLLLTFTNIKNVGPDKIFDRATQAAVDMAAALGGDASGQAIALGKALNDPIKGITALTRVGVTFNDEQKKQIKTMIEHGNTAGAQGVILNELAKEFGGSAAAQATAGEKMSVAWKNLQEQIGTALIPTLDKLENAFAGKVIPAISKGVASLGKTVPPILKEVTGGFRALFAAFKAGNGDVTSNGFAGVMERIGNTAHDALTNFRAFTDYVAAHSAEFATAAVGLTAFASALLAIHHASTVLTTINTVTSAITSMGPAVLAFAGPWGLVAAAVVAVAAAVVYAYVKIKPFHDAVDAVGNVIRDKVGPAVAWLGENILPALSMAWDSVKSAAGSVAGFLGSLGGVFKTVGSTIASAIGTAVAAVVGFIGGMDLLMNHVIPLVQALGGLFAAIGGAIETTFSRLATAVQAAWSIVEPVVVAMASIFEALFEVTLPLLLGLWNVFWTSLSAAVSGTLAIIGPIWTAFWSVFQAVVQTAWDLIYAIIQAALDLVRGIIMVATGIISGDWGVAWDGIKLILSQAWEFMQTIVTTAIEFVKTIISTGIDLIKGLWSAAWGDVKLVLATAWSVMKTAVSTGVDAVVGFFIELPARMLKALATLAGDLAKVAKDALKAMWDAAVKGGDDLQEWFSALPGKVVDWVGDLIMSLYQAGVDLIQGLINGIGSMAGALGRKVHDVVHYSGIDLAKDILGISSPSKVFHEIGQNTMQGFANGIDATSGVVASSTAAVANGVAAGFNGLAGQAFDTGASISSSLAAGMTAPTDDVGRYLASVANEIQQRVKSIKDKFQRDQLEPFIVSQVRDQLRGDDIVAYQDPSGKSYVPDPVKGPQQLDPGQLAIIQNNGGLPPITVNVSLDSEPIAAKVSTTMDRELAGYGVG